MRHLLFVLIIALGSQAKALMNIDQCYDINQKEVFYQQTTQIGQAGEGRILNNYPVILINPQMMSMYQPGVQQFILAHECAHHRLGHIVSLYFNNYFNKTFEFDADCAAIQLMRDMNLLNGQVVNGIFQFVGGLVEDSSHPSGGNRVIYLQQCLNK